MAHLRHYEHVWRELVSRLDRSATFAAPATEAQLSGAASRLKQPIPPELSSLLRETNGITGQYGLGLVWDVDRIVSDNLEFRGSATLKSSYMPFEPLLFFAEAGNGDLFALLSPPLERGDVFAWDHESDTRQWVAGGLEQYLRWWLDGRITV